MLHDLPSDPLAAWFYKNDEGSVEISMSGTSHMGNTTGESARALQTYSAAMHWHYILTSCLEYCRDTDKPVPCAAIGS